MTRRTSGSPRPSGAYQQADDALYGYRETDHENRYRRDWLPDPADYYRRHLLDLKARGEWADARCPFHDDAHASLSVSLNHGGYRCHACGESGGDVLAFHRRLYELGFVRAAKDLDAWDE